MIEFYLYLFLAFYCAAPFAWVGDEESGTTLFDELMSRLYQFRHRNDILGKPILDLAPLTDFEPAIKAMYTQQRYDDVCFKHKEDD